VFTATGGDDGPSAQDWDTRLNDPDFLSALDEHDADRASLTALIESERTDATTARAVGRAVAEYRRLRNRFMCRNLRLVVTVAKRLGRHHMPLQDRVQEGNFGLIKAIDRFDPERGFRFATYAAWWIRHTVTRALIRHGRTVRVPAHLHAVFNKVRRARPVLVAELGREPTVKEIAERIDDRMDRVATAIEAMERRSVALDVPAGNSEGRTIGEMLPDTRTGTWTERMERSFDVPRALQALAVLDDKGLDIVQQRYGLGTTKKTTLRELGKRYGVSRERIRQLQVRAVGEMREAIERPQTHSASVA
jgi:RNA polymerase sigma factor (sigma-70 family)